MEEKKERVVSRRCMPGLVVAGFAVRVGEAVAFVVVVEVVAFVVVEEVECYKEMVLGPDKVTVEVVDPLLAGCSEKDRGHTLVES